MTSFHDFLTERIEAGGFSTEDTLSSFLPLVREVLDAHAAGFVAPLEGTNDIQVDGVRLWFEEAKRQPARDAKSRLRAIEAANRASVEILSEERRTADVGEGTEKRTTLQIGERDAEVTRTVYLPGYVTWEHQLGHHDPLTDVFSLGMILASLSCGLDFNEPAQLEAFVTRRRNLFELNPALHPVLARAVFRMTEVDRHRRVQDLASLLHSLENYRDQEVDFDFDLARIQGFRQQDQQGRQEVILGRLRERLFEISRRNRLLHFRPTMQSVNLTQASIPLTFDIKNIRPNQILIWNNDFKRPLVEGQTISLNKHLNFAEAIYLPGVLDRIIAEARRDQAEYGFAQLRLVICFLSWSNLKEKPVEQFESPLVLVPVRLKKKKGVRDTYTLESDESMAEVNPVVRHQFKQLYDIELPETIDLAQTSLDEFFEYLAGKIQASEPAISLNKIDRPRIALIHDKAKRKLDQYRLRARVSGRGVRTYLDLDYSYDPANYHPLGVKLFSTKLRQSTTALQAILEEQPRPRTFVAPTGDPPVVEKEKTFFQLQEGGDANPYSWNFDLCNLTLANFKYRKISLVRDYESLLQAPRANPAFDATFSLTPRPVDRNLPETPPLEDRNDVIACDPTQALAIAEARAEKSYIIQGPPGTGKSQTITNLIADFVARGKRVLFVCEKRAAIDVVYARLRQCGLGDLCCLIHDSQADKKEFVMNLKQTYESLLAEATGELPRRSGQRKRLLTQMAKELEPLEQFDEMMQSSPAHVGVTVRELLNRCLETAEARPALDSLEKERLPDFATWWHYRDGIERYVEALREVQPDQLMARHPLCLLSMCLAEVDRPLELLTTHVNAAGSDLKQVVKLLAESEIPSDQWPSLERVQALVTYARDVLPLAGIGELALLDAASDRSRQFDASTMRVAQQRQQVTEASQVNRAWKQRLSPPDVDTALEQAQTFDGKTLAWLRPAWWRLRGVLNRCYDFRADVVRRSWTRVLTDLQQEYRQLDALQQLECETARRFNADTELAALVKRVAELRERTSQLPDWLRRIHLALLNSDQSKAIVERVSRAHEPCDRLVRNLDAILDGYANESLTDLGQTLRGIVPALDALPEFLQCLSELRDVPAALRRALTRLPLTPAEVEAAVADHSLTRLYQSDRAFQRFSAATRNRHAQRIERYYEDWLKSNAAAICDLVQRRFLENIREASLPTDQLKPKRKEFKQRYTRGRRELEHEFGKTMRFKSIRELVTGESGDVIKDLKPVWLMSPLSVSDTLPLDTEHVDVVIFDEASQITLEEAVPAVFRARQAIVVGDQMQLPPTDFFSAKRQEEGDEELRLEEDGELVEYDLNSNSFLNHAATNLPSTMLGWHYRSRSESLISFSNWTFYDGRLLTVPEENLPEPNRPPLTARQAEDAADNVDEVYRRAISFHLMEHGVYEKRQNRAEAEYIAQLVREMLKRRSGVSIGVIAFSQTQQSEIEAALQRLAQDDAEFRDLLDAELERDEDGQFVGLLVKNLENIQGDERDVIILSICYGPDPQGKMLMNFGPINKSGGEKRLNVAFSRAKHHMVLVSSIRHGRITNEYNDGANCLKNYLRYAEAVSEGNSQAALRALHAMSPWHEVDQRDGQRHDPLVEQIALALEQQGFVADRHVGQSHFRCDLAVRRDGDSEYRLGILLDGDSYYDQPDVLERDMMRPRLLRAFGWKIAYVLAKDWHEDRDEVLKRLVGLLEGDSECIEDQADDEV